MQDKKTLGSLFIKRTTQDKDKNAVGWIENNEIRFYTYGDYFHVVESLALAFEEIGLAKGQKVAILGHTRKEWHFCDLANLCRGVVVVPIYPSYTPVEIEYIFNHSESSVLVLDTELQFQKLVKIQKKLTSLKAVVTLDEIPTSLLKKLSPEIRCLSYREILRMGGELSKKWPQKFTDQSLAVEPEDMASIIYTSGTTGEPKGAIITHGAIVAMLLNSKASLSGTFSSADRQLTFLPLSHVLGRADSLVPLIFAGEMIFARSLETIIEDISLVKPTVMVAVPRIFEKIYDKINKQINEASWAKRRLFQWAKHVSDIYFEKLQNDLIPTTQEILQKQLAYKLVFSKIYEKFGGKIRFFISGGAPLSEEVIKFLRNAHLCIMEGYGLTETIAPFTLNPPYKQIPGTVGIPLGTGHIRFAEDGEILLKSEALFSGYYKNPKATEEAIKDGWFYTGDIGELTPEGYLRITDRKKDIIVTSGGKNIAPQKIENLLKTKPHMAHAVVIGDKKNYLTALVAIEKDSFLSELTKFGLAKDCSLVDLSRHPEVIKIIKSEIDEVNSELASFETIKRFFIVPDEFSIEGGQLTPSLKVRRKLVHERYKKEIDAMYK